MPLPGSFGEAPGGDCRQSRQGHLTARTICQAQDPVKDAAHVWMKFYIVLFAFKGKLAFISRKKKVS